MSSLSIRQLLLNRWSLQLAATVGFLGFAIGRVDVDDAVRAIGDANYAWAIAALSVFTASKLLAAVRWRLYLSRVADAPLPGLMGAYSIGTMVNMLLPLRAGDFAKIQIVSSRYGISPAALSSSVFTVEAVLDAVTLLALFLFSLVVNDIEVVPNAVIFAFIFLAGGGFVAAVLASRYLPRQMPSWRIFDRLTPRAREILAGAWPKFLDGMVTLRDGRLLSQALGLHFIEWMMRASVFWLLGYSFALDLDPETFLLLTLVVSIATLFPVTFLNFGTFQVVVTEVLVAAGAPRGEAFAYAIASHALLHAWILVMGVTAMVMMHVSSNIFGETRRLRAESRAD